MTINRRTLMTCAGLAAVTAAAGALPEAKAAAATPQSIPPFPGALRRKIGDITVTALLDGYLDVQDSLLVGFDAADARNLAESAFQAPGPQRIPVTAYLVNSGGNLILVDAGTADTFGPTLGRLPEALRAAGVEPSDIDMLAITHLHPDHINGALAPDGSALFPNAELMVSETDYRFWHHDSFLSQADEHARGFFLGARKGVAAYRDRLNLFTDNTEIAPGLHAVALPGHTPGHTGFRIESGKDSLLIWGDVAHIATYQFARPDWGISFDTDVDQARATRKKVLDQVATDRLMIAGMHLPFPGFGHVARQGSSYRFVPAEWPYTL
ncbi:MBL fold metallo-hydrolase [Nisaea sp.]|uniref:MBL fold metallo-hydrolase n=1 Tax=Nisaea sp. TaxID=2024842 RepID=UPI003266260B